MVKAEYAHLCDEYQDVFQDPGMPPRHLLDHAIDLIDQSLPLPKHWQVKDVHLLPFCKLLNETRCIPYSMNSQPV